MDGIGGNVGGSKRWMKGIVGAVVALVCLGPAALGAHAAVTPTDCADLQNALDTANTGDTIVLKQLCTVSNSGVSAGAFVYMGNQSFTLEGQSGSGAGFDGTTVGQRPLSFTGASSPTT